VGLTVLEVYNTLIFKSFFKIKSELLYPKDKFICKSEVRYVVGDFMASRKFTVFLEPAEEGGFVVKCLVLPVASQGETKEEALKNIKEAIEGYLEIVHYFWT
jgi:predicted RNase H-like HicB family nuclease